MSGIADDDSSDERRMPKRDGAAGVDSLAALLSMPGYLFRRSKQVSTSVFAETCREFGITPTQFAALTILRFRPACDQTELGEIAALDSSTAGDVVQRLERRGWIERQDDGHGRVCRLTHEGAKLLERVTPRVAQAQQIVLGELTPREQSQLLRLMSKLNGVSNLHYTRSNPRGRRRRPFRRLVTPALPTVGMA